MSRTNEFESLYRGLQEGSVDRRQFMFRAFMLGLSASSIAFLLEACSGGETPPPASGSGEAPASGSAPPTPASASTPPAPSEGDQDLPEMEKELSIYNWSDYIAEDTVANFEKEFNVKVTYDTYESNEDMMAKLQVGAGGYDLVVPSGYIVEVLKKTDLVSPLHKKYLTNWGNLSKIFLDNAFDKGNQYSVPWQWGTTGIAYRTDKIAAPPDSWGIFLDKTYAGKMTQMDDERDVIGCWLRYRGHSLNSVIQAELDQAKADAIAAKANIKAYVSADVKGQLIAGDVWLAQLWNGDTAQAKTQQPNLGYVLPKEGATIWLDNLVVPKGAPHKRAAHEFINYILRPDVGAAISNATGYGTPNEKAMAGLTIPVPYPTEDDLKRLEYQNDLGAATEMWDNIWTEIKSG